MTESEFEQVLLRSEGESIDFKANDYSKLTDESKRSASLKI